MISISKQSRFIVYGVSAVVIIGFFFQNCAKVNFQKDIESLSPTEFTPTSEPATLVPGEVVGTLKPFAVEAQEVVPKTKMLIVVDNSASMSNSQKNLAKGLDSIFSSLEEQIQNGLNPEVEFYIVSTTIPDVTPNTFSFYQDSVSKKTTINYFSSNPLAKVDLARGTVIDDPSQYCGFGGCFLSALPDYFNGSANISKFVLNDMGSEKVLSQNELMKYIENDEIQKIPELSAADYMYQWVNAITQLNNTPVIQSYLGFVGVDIKNDNLANYWLANLPPTYLLKDGSPLRYSAAFDLNTNYPTFDKNGLINGSIPFSKVTLDPSKYLVKVNSADRQVDLNKFSALRDELKNKITAVSVRGSNKEMGLCALHRSLSMSGANQIFTQNDRAAFLIISDEQDSQTKWSDCLISGEFGSEKPVQKNISLNCSGGESCVFPAKTSDYTASVNYDIFYPADSGTRQTSVIVSGSYTNTYYEQVEQRTFTGRYYIGSMLLNFATDYTYMYNLEGQLTKVQNDGKNGHPLVYDMSKLSLTFGSIDNYLSSTWTNHQILTQADLNNYGSGGLCSTEARSAALNELLRVNSKFKNFYSSLTEAEKTKAFDCQSVIVGEFKATSVPNLISRFNSFAWTQLYTLSRYVSNSQCAQIHEQKTCDASMLTSVKAAICGQGNGSCESTLNISSCIEDCAPAVDQTYSYTSVVTFKTQDLNFISDFKSGYQKKFQAKIENLDKDYIVYDSYEQMISKNPRIKNFVFKKIAQTVQSTDGKRSIASVVDYQKYVKNKDVSGKMIEEGFLFTPEKDPSSLTDGSLQKMKKQIVSAFHMRAKKMFNNNYFVSSIVIPNDNSYQGGRCPGVPDQESQSPGGDYLTLIDDVYFSKYIQLQGQNILQVDANRKAFADICSGNYSKALEPLKNFITKIPKNKYNLKLPTNRIIHSIVIKSKDKSDRILGVSDWNYEDGILSMEAGAIQIDDIVVVNLTIAESEIKQSSN